jgi:hypothetical protein
MNISSKTHYCKGLEKGDWFNVVGYSAQSERLIVEYINDFREPALMYKFKSDFEVKDTE